jgi:hypothetical protein
LFAHSGIFSMIRNFYKIFAGLDFGIILYLSGFRKESIYKKVFNVAPPWFYEGGIPGWGVVLDTPGDGIGQYNVR